MVAAHIGTVHHELHFTVQEGLDALSDVIHHLETFDVTTIRAATPMYLMARRIRTLGIKMVLSGEGADEVFGGYLYFHRAPDPRSFHDETVRKLDRLHQFDCLRANKAMAAWGVEARVPFLDKEFLDVAMSMDPAAKMPGRAPEWDATTGARWPSVRVRAGPRRSRGPPRGRSRSASCGKHSPTICPPRSSGVRRSSSPTGSATGGSIRSRRSPTNG